MSTPAKTYYPIREVAALLDIPASTLRFWEEEFPMFNPDRTKGGQRRYMPEQVKLAKLIKDLLYNKGLKIDAAIEYLNASYRKSRPQRIPLCDSASEALAMLNSVKVALDTNTHAVAKVKAVERWIKSNSKGNTK